MQSGSSVWRISLTGRDTNGAFNPIFSAATFIFYQKGVKMHFALRTLNLLSNFNELLIDFLRDVEVFEKLKDAAERGQSAIEAAVRGEARMVNLAKWWYLMKLAELGKGSPR